MATFGELLKRYRMAARDENGKALTQQQLTALLEVDTGLQFSKNMISEWERGKNLVSRSRRAILISLLKILHAYHGFQTKSQANEMLAAGDYGALMVDEQRLVFPETFGEFGKPGLRTEEAPLPFSETGPTDSGRYVVGRQAEVNQFAAMLQNTQPYWLLNIFGPGGIGKTIVGSKLRAYAQHREVPIAFIDGNQPGLTQESMLYTIKQELAQNQEFIECFQTFDKEWEDNVLVQDILRRGGGVPEMFDSAGGLRSPSDFNRLMSTLGHSISDSLRSRVSNRFALERYLRGVERTLINSISAGLQAAINKTHSSLAIVIDTYEEMEGYDDWICRALAPALPKGVILVILGRNALQRVNFDWNELGHSLNTQPLGELSESEAKSYLNYYGLTDQTLLNQVYRLTGGYPLLLVLVRQLKQELGSWERIDVVDSDAERDRIATKLLERILREQPVREVKDFLEKGAAARWFTPDIVRVVLDINPADARTIYDKLSRHSFVERHPNGLKFHDKIRELLEARLKFNKSEYDLVVSRLRDYYADQAGASIA